MAHSLRISLAVVHLAERIECKGEGLPLVSTVFCPVFVLSSVFGRKAKSGVKR